MKKKITNLQESPIPFYKAHLEAVLVFSIVLCAAIYGGWQFYKAEKVKQERIARYESAMNKRIYKPCAKFDEDGEKATFTHWTEDDPELKGFPRDEETGEYLPIKDRNGKILEEPPVNFPGETKTIHIPYLRGFAWSDGYGESNCMPCSKADTQQAINICNDKNSYYNINRESKIEDLDDANPSLVKEIQGQESAEDILIQQQEVWSNEINKVAKIEEPKIEE